MAVSGAGDVMAAAGNSHEDEGRNGEIHVFTKPSGGWADSNAPDVLKAGRGRAQDLFGRFVTMTGDGSAVAAGRLHRQEGDFRGSVVLFNRPSGGWADDSSVDEEFLGVKAAGRLGWHTVFDRTTGALYFRPPRGDGHRQAAVDRLPNPKIEKPGTGIFHPTRRAF